MINLFKLFISIIGISLFFGGIHCIFNIPPVDKPCESGMWDEVGMKYAIISGIVSMVIGGGLVWLANL